MTRGTQRAHCSPVTLDRRNSATLHRPQSRARPAASQRNKKGLNLFCRGKKIQGRERRKHILSLKMTKLQSRRAPEEKQLVRQCRNLPAESQLPRFVFFFFPSLWPPSLSRRIQQTSTGEGEKNTPTTPKPRASQGARRHLQITGALPRPSALVLTHSEEDLGTQAFPCSIRNPNIAALS